MLRLLAQDREAGGQIKDVEQAEAQQIIGGGGGLETDPVFSASEAALLVSGDKDRIDRAVVRDPVDGKVEIAGANGTVVTLDPEHNALRIENPGSYKIEATDYGLEVSSSGEALFLTGEKIYQGTSVVNVKDRKLQGGTWMQDGEALATEDWANQKFVEKDNNNRVALLASPFMIELATDSGEIRVSTGPGNWIIIGTDEIYCSVAGETKFHLKADGTLTVKDLPTSDPGNPGQIWNDSGTLKVSL